VVCILLTRGGKHEIDVGVVEGCLECPRGALCFMDHDFSVNVNQDLLSMSVATSPTLQVTSPESSSSSSITGNGDDDCASAPPASLDSRSASSASRSSPSSTGSSCAFAPPAPLLLASRSASNASRSSSSSKLALTPVLPARRLDRPRLLILALQAHAAKYESCDAQLAVHPAHHLLAQYRRRYR
jgi:hypothetical protein